MKKSLVSVRSTLDKELDPARDLLESLSAAEKNLQERIPKAWKTYYFTPAGGFFSWEAWLESAKRMSSFSPRTRLSRRPSNISTAAARMPKKVPPPVRISAMTQTDVDDPYHYRVEGVGRAFPHVEVKVADIETGQELPRGKQGELCCRGYNAMDRVVQLGK